MHSLIVRFRMGWIGKRSALLGARQASGTSLRVLVNLFSDFSPLHQLFRSLSVPSVWCHGYVEFHYTRFTISLERFVFGVDAKQETPALISAASTVAL